MAAIPTEYSGIRFRSRIEARWAAMFDEVGWPWKYEPIDLCGYIPDFVLPLSWDGEDHPIIIEVKSSMYINDLVRHVSKIYSSGWGGDALIVGSVLFEQKETGSPILGAFVDCRKHEVYPAWSMKCDECERVSFAAGRHLTVDDAGNIIHMAPRDWYQCRLCDDTGQICGGGHVRSSAQWTVDDIFRAWDKAGNAVQWKGPVGA